MCFQGKLTFPSDLQREMTYPLSDKGRKSEMGEDAEAKHTSGIQKPES